MALPRINTGLAREERLPTALLLFLFLMLCVAGGASREDVLAQAVVRSTALLVILVQLLAGRLPKLSRYRSCAWLLGAMIVLAALQLVPLPPAIWTALPGRDLLAASPLGAHGWRPWNLVPDAGWNSLFSLSVPLSVLVLLATLEEKTVRRAQYVLIGCVVFSALLALLQASGVAPNNPLINGNTADYAGVFANRNHQALFLSIGIVACLFWGLERGGDLRDRRLWIAVLVVLLLAVSILVTGSRSGAILGVLAIIATPFCAQTRRHGQRKSATSRFFRPTTSAAVVGAVFLLGAYFGRGLSIDRVAALNLQQDFRLRALPTVWQVVTTYFPFGAGLGSFDAVFRRAEPLALLEPDYFNHAHNDFMETVIETGIFGPIILAIGLFWLVRRVVAASGQGRGGARISRLGALIIGLILIAGATDYAARTPMIMAVLMCAACWTGGISGNRVDGSEDALPVNGNYL